MNKKTTILIAVLALITLIAISLMVWAIWFRDPVIIPPDYNTDPEDTNRIPLDSEGGDKLETPEGGGAVGIIYTKDGISVDLSDKKISLLFGNPSRSNMDMIIQVVVRNQLIAQSGRLVPGYKLQTLDLANGAEKKLVPGTYDAKYIVYYYDPESGEKAILNTEIPITIQVKE